MTVTVGSTDNDIDFRRCNEGSLIKYTADPFAFGQPFERAETLRFTLYDDQNMDDMTADPRWW